MSDDYIKRHDSLNRSFASGDIFNQTEAQFQTHLRTLGEFGIENPNLHPTEIIRALVINHLQMERIISELRNTMEALNRENGKVSRRVFWLTVISMLCGLVQAFGVYWVIRHTN